MKKLIIKGEMVTYNFFPGDPHEVSHGEFLIQNPGQDTQTLKVQECFFLDGGKKIKIDKFFIYSGDSEFTETISLPPASELTIRISFPFQTVNEKTKNNYGIEIVVSHEKNILKAVSEIRVEWERRIG